MEDDSLGDALNPWGVELFRITERTEPESASEQAAFGKWLDQTTDRETARQDRIHGAAGVMPTPLWIALFFISAVVVVYLLAFADSGERAAVQALYAGSVVSVIVAMLLLLAFLDNPVSGGIGGLEPKAMERGLGPHRRVDRGVRHDRRAAVRRGRPALAGSGISVPAGGDDQDATDRRVRRRVPRVGPRRAPAGRGLRAARPHAAGHGGGGHHVGPDDGGLRQPALHEHHGDERLVRRRASRPASRRSRSTASTTGTAPADPLLDELGPHTTGKSCLYIKRLGDVDQDVLERMVRDACAQRPRRRVSEEQAAPAERSTHSDVVEIVATVLLALAAVATAWSSYQAARWNGHQAETASRNNAVRIQAARAESEAEAETEVDVALFIQWVDATAAEDDELASFYESRLPRRVPPGLRRVGGLRAAHRPGWGVDAVRHAGVPPRGDGRGRTTRRGGRGAHRHRGARHPARHQLRPRRRAVRGGPLLRRHQHQGQGPARQEGAGRDGGLDVRRVDRLDRHVPHQPQHRLTSPVDE